jgi:signal transduction histidine kinase
MVKKIITYLNPIANLGNRKYPYWLAVLIPLVTIGILEFYAYKIAHDPLSISLAAIFVFISFIIYFCFRAGILGGFITVIITLGYYAFIIYSRHYTGEKFTSGVDTTIILGGVYLFLAFVIGWLKQTIDALIERESNGRRRLEAIIQQLPVGVIITDAQGKVVQANKRLEEILGTKIPLGFAMGRDEFEIKGNIGDKPAQPSQSPLSQAITSGKPVLRKEFVIERKDKKTVYVTVNATPIHNRDGKIVAAASIITDVTTQKEMEKRKDDFVNMASHELKTPITSMKLYIDSLTTRTQKLHDETITKIVSRIKNQTERLQELVNDLLDVSRIQTGKLIFTMDKFRLDELMVETVDELQASAENRLHLLKTVPTIVSADRFRVYQVITNLITNAIKYSAGTGEISIKIKKQKGEVIVSVADQGIGISKDQQKKVFDRLYQVSDDKEKTFPGFGMGLYISKEIITRHRGKIWVESEKGKGSTFYFCLPVSKNV